MHNNYRRAKFLTSLKQVSPDTVTAIEKAPEQPLDYGQAILEVESVAKTSPELSQIMTELVKAIEAEPSLKELVNNTLKSQSQQASVINNQKLADFIKNVFQGNTFGSSLLGMVRYGGINRLNPYLARDLID